MARVCNELQAVTCALLRDVIAIHVSSGINPPCETPDGSTHLCFLHLLKTMIAIGTNNTAHALR